LAAAGFVLDAAVAEVFLAGVAFFAAVARFAGLLLDAALVALGIRFSPSPPQRCRTLRHHPPIRQWPVSTSKAGRVAA
jgi:hypothetical protein